MSLSQKKSKLASGKMCKSSCIYNYLLIYRVLTLCSTCSGDLWEFCTHLVKVCLPFSFPVAILCFPHLLIIDSFKPNPFYSELKINSTTVLRFLPYWNSLCCYTSKQYRAGQPLTYIQWLVNNIFLSLLTKNMIFFFYIHICSASFSPWLSSAPWTDPHKHGDNFLFLLPIGTCDFLFTLPTTMIKMLKQNLKLMS